MKETEHLVKLKGRLLNVFLLFSDSQSSFLEIIFPKKIEDKTNSEVRNIFHNLHYYIKFLTCIA